MNEDIEYRGLITEQGGPGKVKRKGFTGSGNRKPLAWEKLVFVLNPPTTPHHKRQERVKLSPTGRWNLGIARNCHGPGTHTGAWAFGAWTQGRSRHRATHTRARPGRTNSAVGPRGYAQMIGRVAPTWQMVILRLYVLIGQYNGSMRAQRS